LQRAQEGQEIRLVPGAECLGAAPRSRGSSAPGSVARAGPGRL